jgi:hypothetical protein
MEAPPPPADFICPISQDIMKDPVEVIHNGSSFYFDRVYLDTWKRTPSGNKNPLTMLEGFATAEVKPCLTLKTRITEYCSRYNIEQTQVTPELQPFSDFDQIQEDERVAVDLHRELNAHSDLLEYIIERQYTNYLVNTLRNAILEQIDGSNELLPREEILNVNNHINNHIEPLAEPIVNFVNFINNINPDDDQ